MSLRIILGLAIAGILLLTNIAFATIYKDDVILDNANKLKVWNVLCKDQKQHEIPLSTSGLDAAYSLGMMTCGRENFSIIDSTGAARLDIILTPKAVN